MLRAVVLFAITALISQTSASEPVRYVRADERPVAGNPALAAQAQQDAAICKGEGAKAALSAGTVQYQGVLGSLAADQTIAKQSRMADQVVEGCMAQRGYRRVSN